MITLYSHNRAATGTIINRTQLQMHWTSLSRWILLDIIISSKRITWKFFQTNIAYFGWFISPIFFQQLGSSLNNMSAAGNLFPTFSNALVGWFFISVFQWVICLNMSWKCHVSITHASPCNIVKYTRSGKVGQATYFHVYCVRHSYPGFHIVTGKRPRLSKLQSDNQFSKQVQKAKLINNLRSVSIRATDTVPLA